MWHSRILMHLTEVYGEKVFPRRAAAELHLKKALAHARVVISERGLSCHRHRYHAWYNKRSKQCTHVVKVMVLPQI